MGAPSDWIGAGSVVLLLALSGCATGDGPEFTSQAFDGGATDGGETSGLTSTSTNTGVDDSAGDPSGQGSGGPFPPDLGTCQSDEDCMLGPGFCLQTQGQCVEGMCQHGPAAPGQSCDDADPCTEADACDGAGICFGVALDCSAPNAVGGECVAGMCTEPECAEGWGDCNGDMSDGCEVALGTEANCGGCGDVCTAGAHADGSCVAGACSFECQAPWDNCDGDWANGCEIPVGMPHQCDINGLNPGNGCWTAYCGNSGAAAVNFDSFHCMDCATCRSPAAGSCQWCDHDGGTFFPADSCACGTFEDLSCG